ncbi:hypothetical protein GH808_06645 [Acetobacterium fimetarium]|uniref:Uncharacterized protein n=1 Tax=Acetobacterium fimetarium TaxID=52691 RepID=A0ABR6WU12_9FIRM|nr:hypothetical protein [Acetobacterium fimetarium]MBC3804114.1 hypothetical protein [Acetobacterium fimetarium]
MEKCCLCGIELEKEEIYAVKGKIFCDDCALGQHKLVQACDPSAVHSAKLDRQRSGHTGIQGLTPRQKELYEYLVANNGVTVGQFVEKFGLTAEEVSLELSVLRHAELGKGQKRADGVYFVPWES